MLYPKKNQPNGFTLIEMLVVISIVGFLMVAGVVSYKLIQMGSRDAVRAGNIVTLKKALDMYANETSAYPPSAEDGECLSNADGNPGKALVNRNLIANIPADPLWPSDDPLETDGIVNDGQTNFCYFYYSDDPSTFRLSYYFETNSEAGVKGIHYASPGGFFVQ